MQLDEGHTELPAPVVPSEPSKDDMSEHVLPILCGAAMSRKDGGGRLSKKSSLETINSELSC